MVIKSHGLAAACTATAILAVVLAVIPASYAGTVTRTGDPPGDVTFVANPGETNSLNVPMFAPDGWIITDSGATLTAGTGCVSVGPNSADCGNLFFRDFNAYLGDVADRAFVLWVGVVRIWGGAGNDNVLASAYSQWGEVYGEAGDDVVTAVGEGGQVADGGPGNDVLEIVAWGGQSTGVGGTGDDVISFRNAITAAGPATLDGGNGNDAIYAQPTRDGTSTATGGPGNDTIVMTPFDGYFGTQSLWVLIGGAGNDTLTGGISIDTVNGGPGNDLVDVTGGGVDTVTCGTGTDVVHYDASDTVAPDCEVLFLS